MLTTAHSSCSYTVVGISAAGLPFSPDVTECNRRSSAIAPSGGRVRRRAGGRWPREEGFVYEVDLLPVENPDQDGGKSGDAIAMRFDRRDGQGTAVVVIDGGFRDIGDDLVEHIQEYYGTKTVDLMISTHPDQDHVNGLVAVVNGLTVRRLLIHQPRLHTNRLGDFTNLEALDELLKVARRRGVTITEPFTGQTYFGGQVRILGPTRDYYRQLLGRQTTSQAIRAKASFSWPELFFGRQDALSRTRLSLPPETLTDDVETAARNSSSVVTLVTVDARRLLFTGDAGIEALEHAAVEYERAVGKFDDSPLALFQGPHHGSRHNLGPTILNRILGTPEAPFNPGCTAVISSAKAAPKHPSPKVVNALARRGCKVLATEGNKLVSSNGASPRPGWSPAQALPPLVEDEDLS